MHILWFKNTRIHLMITVWAWNSERLNKFYFIQTPRVNYFRALTELLPELLPAQTRGKTETCNALFWQQRSTTSFQKMQSMTCFQYEKENAIIILLKPSKVNRWVKCKFIILKPRKTNIDVEVLLSCTKFKKPGWCLRPKNVWQTIWKTKQSCPNFTTHRFTSFNQFSLLLSLGKQQATWCVIRT